MVKLSKRSLREEINRNAFSSMIKNIFDVPNNYVTNDAFKVFTYLLTYCVLYIHKFSCERWIYRRQLNLPDNGVTLQQRHRKKR